MGAYFLCIFALNIVVTHVSSNKINTKLLGIQTVLNTGITALATQKNQSKFDFFNTDESEGGCNMTSEESTCGTIEYLGCTGSKKFFHESAVKMNWFEAWEYCRSVGLHLAAIESRYEQIFIELFLPQLEITNPEAYWTSGTDLGKEGQFSWMASGRGFSYTNFRPGEPNNRFGAEDCIELVVLPGLTGYSWNDRNCLAKAYVLCQHDSWYPEKFMDAMSSLPATENQKNKE